jgi:hypothetical protein
MLQRTCIYLVKGEISMEVHEMENGPNRRKKMETRTTKGQEKKYKKSTGM